MCNYALHSSLTYNLALSMTLLGHGGSSVYTGKRTGSAVSRPRLESQLQHFASCEVMSNSLNLPLAIIYLSLCKKAALNLAEFKQ